MIIDRIVRGLAQVVLVLVVWSILLLLMPLVGPAGRQVAVVGGSSDAVRAITAAGGRIVDPRHGATIAISDDPAFVRRLYAAGARAVIEGRIAAGCFAKNGA